MLDSIHVAAPAKINISLKVLPKRADGFHDIESIFQKVALFDDITVRRTEKPGCVVETEGMNLPEENTLTSAYAGFVDETGISGGIAVRLIKRIPSGAGLGGGSSDAATLIGALDALFDTGLTVCQQTKIALAVGSDVAFFLSGNCAVVTGRGEHIRVIESRKDCFCLLVYPDVHSSTGEAYSMVDKLQTSADAGMFPAVAGLERMYQGNISGWKFSNSFTGPVTGRYPVIAEAIADMRNCGSLYTQMTGTGSTVFGVFGSETDAETAYTQLSRKWKKCYVAAFL